MKRIWLMAAFSALASGVSGCAGWSAPSATVQACASARHLEADLTRPQWSYRLPDGAICPWWRA